MYDLSLGGGFIFLILKISPRKPGEMIQFDEQIFEVGWKPPTRTSLFLSEATQCETLWTILFLQQLLGSVEKWFCKKKTHPPLFFDTPIKLTETY